MSVAANPSADELFAGLHGRVRDVDSHEMFPARLWAQEYGEQFAPLAEFFIQATPEDVANSVSVQRIHDDAPITQAELESYWGEGCLAAGAFDMGRRLEVMDLAGVERSFVFGTSLAFAGQRLAVVGGDFMQRNFGSKMAFDPTTMGHAVITAHNDWCIRAARRSKRLYPVAVILTHTLEGALEESKRVFGAGVRTVQLPACQPIAGRSPAHPDNDPLWKFYAENNIAVMLHAGSEPALLREHLAWFDAPPFAQKGSHPMEIQNSPFSLATLGLGAQNYLTSMVFGAVFERFPNLRFGVMELGGHWMGPMTENMDIWAEQFHRRLRGLLTMPPSEYVRRNVRTTPFNFEPVDTYIERFPFMQDVYCFSTDYPHLEGGKHPVQLMLDRVIRLGTDVVEKFFVTNAEWVMPNEGPARENAASPVRQIASHFSS
jgi:predicted TIM-barrel fold metal-dependent hydrolase